MTAMSVPPLAIVQARMRSTRLHGKVMLPLADNRPILHHVVMRAITAFGRANVVVATGPAEHNAAIVDWCRRHAVACVAYEGDESDVLTRFHAVAHAFRWHPSSVLVRITADDPFKSPEAMREVAEGWRHPVEVGGEAFTLAMLDDADAVVLDPAAREHITDALFPTRVPLIADGQVWTVDTPADYDRAVERSRAELRTNDWLTDSVAA